MGRAPMPHDDGPLYQRPKRKPYGVEDALAELCVLVHDHRGRRRARATILVEVHRSLPLLTDRRRLRVGAVLFYGGALESYLTQGGHG